MKKAGEEGDWKKKTRDSGVWKRLSDEAVKKLRATPHSRQREKGKRDMKVDKRALIEELAAVAKQAAHMQTVAKLCIITKESNGVFKNHGVPMKYADEWWLRVWTKQTQLWKTHVETILNRSLLSIPKVLLFEGSKGSQYSRYGEPFEPSDRPLTKNVVLLFLANYQCITKGDLLHDCVGPALNCPM